MSIGQLKTPTFAFFVFLMLPSGSRPKTMPFTTLLCSRLPPMIFTTRMLSTLKFIGCFGRTARMACETMSARNSSLPFCFEAMTVLMALASSASERRSLTLSTTSSEKTLASHSTEYTCSKLRDFSRTVQTSQSLTLRSLEPLYNFTSLQSHP